MNIFQIASTAVSTALLLSASVHAATVSVNIPSVGLVDDSGVSPAVAQATQDAAGRAFVDGASGRLGGSSSANAMSNALSTAVTNSRTGPLEFFVSGSGLVSVAMSALVTADWGKTINSNARIEAGISFSTGYGDRLEFQTGPDATGTESGRLVETLSFTAELTGGRRYLFNANLLTQSSATCVGVTPNVRDCGSAFMDSTSTMTVFLDSITPGAALTQVSGDAFALQSPAPVPLPAAGILLICGVGVLRTLRVLRTPV